MDIEAYISSGILETYVLGQATAEEAAILACVVRNNARVREALAEISETLEAMTDQSATLPPPHLKAALQSRLSFETAPAETVHTKQSTGKTRALPQPAAPEIPSTNRSVFWRNLALAASLLFLASAGGYLYSIQQESRTAARLNQMEKALADNNIQLDYYRSKEWMLAQPNMQLVMLQGVEKHPDARAMVMWNAKTHDVHLDIISMPQAPTGKQYQLWALVDGKPVSVGMYNNDAPLSAFSAPVDKAQAFAITLEPEGGVESPTMENLMVMGEVKG